MWIIQVIKETGSTKISYGGIRHQRWNLMTGKWLEHKAICCFVLICDDDGEVSTSCHCTWWVLIHFRPSSNHSPPVQSRRICPCHIPSRPSSLLWSWYKDRSKLWKVVICIPTFSKFNFTHFHTQAGGCRQCFWSGEPSANPLKSTIVPRVDCILMGHLVKLLLWAESDHCGKTLAFSEAVKMIKEGSCAIGPKRQHQWSGINTGLRIKRTGLVWFWNFGEASSTLSGWALSPIRGRADPVSKVMPSSMILKLFFNLLSLDSVAFFLISLTCFYLAWFYHYFPMWLLLISLPLHLLSG